MQLQNTSSHLKKNTYEINNTIRTSMDRANEETIRLRNLIGNVEHNDEQKVCRLLSSNN